VNILYTFILFFLLSCLPIFSEGEKTNLNLFLYVSKKNEDNSEYSKLIPFYSYRNDVLAMEDEFTFWPFLSGYHNKKNPLPATFPHATEFNWNCIPFLFLGSSKISPHHVKESSSFVSFLLMSYLQETYIDKHYAAKSFYSLPMLSLYQREILTEKEFQLDKTEVGTAISWLKDINIQYKQQKYSIYDWTMHPLCFILWDDIPRISRQARWGKDYLFELFSWSSFSLFSFSITYSVYPGAEYNYFARYECDTQQALERLFSTSSIVPFTKMGILSPFIEFSSTPQGKFTSQILPLFYYESTPEKYTCQILPLGIEFGTDGIYFRPQFKKFFPILYHDISYNRWDIFWPLAYYQKNPLFSEIIFHIRFLFHYEHYTNSQGLHFTDISILEGFLLSYKQQEKIQQIEILPAGFLLGYYKYEDEIECRLLGCGYKKTQDRTSLQFLFIKIPISYH